MESPNDPMIHPFGQRDPGGGTAYRHCFFSVTKPVQRQALRSSTVLEAYDKSDPEDESMLS